MQPDPTRLKDTIRKILTNGKGILAADESSGTIKKRFDSIKVESTETTRRDYRNMLFTTEGYEKFISGVILFDETVDQKVDEGGAMKSSERSDDVLRGRTFPELIAGKGIVPGIKTDEGMEEHPHFAPQKVTRGLKGLAKRLAAYTERSKGTLRFTKWRQAIVVEPQVSQAYLDYTMHVMAEQAAIALSAGYVPINEPEVLMDGSHTMDACAELTERTLSTLFQKLSEHGVDPALTILKTNMVLSGKPAQSEDRSGMEPKKDASEEVAKATLAVFKNVLPKELPGVVFLSGGQKSIQATENLNACVLEAKKLKTPWVLSFSYGRALQDDALKAWAGNHSNYGAAQAALLKRARLNSLAQGGEYEPSLELEKVNKIPASAARWDLREYRKMLK